MLLNQLNQIFLRRILYLHKYGHLIGQKRIDFRKVGLHHLRQVEGQRLFTAKISSD